MSAEPLATPFTDSRVILPIPLTFERMYMLDVDLADTTPDVWNVDGYSCVLALVRWRGRTLTAVTIACPDQVVTRAAVGSAVAQDPNARASLTQRAVRAWLVGRDADGTTLSPAAPVPSWSVVVCTRDRPADLRRCLEALIRLDVPAGGTPGEIVVVDNASSDDQTARVVDDVMNAAGGRRPVVRYVREDRPGLNWARARGARAAGGDIVAYTDDDVVVDRMWIARILEPFADSRVGAVTGLTMPLEIENRTQWRFERYGGFAKGFVRRVFDPQNFPPAAAGAAGAGANMAYRRSILQAMRFFDVELDAGTVTHTGGDTYAFYRVLAAGYHIVYTPDAVVWHRHRRDDAALVRTLYGYSVGGFAFLTRCLVEHRDLTALRVAMWWLRGDHARLVARAVLRRRSALPWGMVLAYCRGVAVGPWAYLRSRGRERRYRSLDAAASAAPTSSDVRRTA